MGDVKTAVNGSFHGAENSGTSGGSHETSVQVTPEGTGAIIGFLDVVLVTCDLDRSGVQSVESQFFQELK